MNTFGVALRLSTFGESHGAGVGCVLDGVPAGLRIDEDFIAEALKRRAPGRTRYATQRKEPDKAEILSGVFEGVSTGAPIAIYIANTAKKSSDYENLKELFRPGHADYTYFHKYGVRDYRGGGRSSARESAARVAGGAIAALMLREFGIVVEGGVLSVGEIAGTCLDFTHAQTSPIFALDKEREEAQCARIEAARKAHNSVGGVVALRARGLMAGLGEPLYHKLDSALGAALLGLNAVKAVEIGDGIRSSTQSGSEHNDELDKMGFLSNHSGGVLGGISNGDELLVRVHFKPTPSIFLPQRTLDTSGNERVCEIKGRHDPCVAVRGCVVAEAMINLVLADMLLLHTTATMENLKRVYKSF